jgi:uncharacterized lipoprotein YajG
MRRQGMMVGILAASCLLAGCDSGAPTATPEEAKAGQDFVLKNVTQKGPLAKGKTPEKGN